MIATKENIEELLKDRSVRDKLSQHNHPNAFRNANGFNYLDWIQWSIFKYKKVLAHDIKRINKMIEEK